MPRTSQPPIRQRPPNGAVYEYGFLWFIIATVYREPEKRIIPDVKSVPAHIFFFCDIVETPTRPRAQTWIM